MYTNERNMDMLVHTTKPEPRIPSLLSLFRNREVQIHTINSKLPHATASIKTSGKTMPLIDRIGDFAGARPILCHG